MSEESYSYKTKLALTAVHLGTDGQLRAELSAIVSTCGALHLEREGIRVELTTENRELRTRIDAMIARLYGSATESEPELVQFNRTYAVFSIPSAVSEAVLRDCAILRDGHLIEGISPELIDSLDDRRAYLRGAFFGGGTLSFGGKSGYLLEFAFSRESVAEDFLSLLNGLELGARLVERNNRFVAYLKDAQEICDAMAHIGAAKAVVDIQAARAERMMTDKITRQCNCDVSNAARAVEAAQSVIQDIQKLRTTVGLDALDEKLRAAALAREADPTATLEGLAATLGLTKSCLRHRLRKLSELARELP